METTSPSPTLGDAYRLGLRLEKLPGRSPFAHLFRPMELAHSLTPIDYVRYREFDFTFSAFRQYAPADVSSILDISSPRLVPLTLAWANPAARVRVMNILQEEVDGMNRAADRLGLANVQAGIEDARALTFADESFDVVTSISVLEHIAPEDGGEIPAVREIGRVLKKGGVAIITVPFALQRFSEFRKGSVYERTGDGDESIFFQRFYDRELLRRNIVDPSGLSLVEEAYIEERFFFRDPHKRMAHYINSTAMQKAVFGPFFPAIARVFLSTHKPLEMCEKPYIACLVLRKS